MRFVSTALVMMALALMLLALMLLTPTVRANPMTFVANFAEHGATLYQFDNPSQVPGNDIGLKPGTRSSIQNDSGLPQGPAGASGAS